MTLDVRGSLKNTKINRNSYVMVDELLSNAIDSYLIRNDEDNNLTGLKVEFFVEFFDKNIEADSYDLKISCSDNGAGLGDEQTKAFITKDTSYKDDLNVQGIGKCKGIGRIQFLHYFSKLEIDSIYTDENGRQRRQLKFDSNVKEIDENSFIKSDTDQDELGTTVSLDGIKPNIYAIQFSDKNLRDEFSAISLRNHVIVSFLQRFVSLKESLGNFRIEFRTLYKNEKQDASLGSEDLPEVTSKKNIKVFYQDVEGKNLDRFEELDISHYKLSKTNFRLSKNAVALCAKSSIVLPITNRYLRTKAIENNDIDGFYHIILVESPYLDEHVNELRDNFDIPKDSHNIDLFLRGQLSFEAIFNSLEDAIEGMLVPPSWDKEKIVESVGEKYGVSEIMIAEVDVRVHYGDTEDSIVKRVLSAYQEKIIKDTSDIFDIKEEITQVEPHSDDFRKKINELAWKYTASLKSIDMVNLSQLVVRRAAIIEILSLAINQDLDIQKVAEDERRMDERIIHNIFFPMGKDSLEVKDHDIWLLSEEYQYYKYIASDKPLSKILWDDSQLLFDSDIDAELQKILEKNSDLNSAKRPDIALFNKEGSVVIIEFKAPGVNMDDHTGDLMEYSQLLAAKSKGRLKKFYGYLIGNDVNPNRIRGYTRFPNGSGWFGTESIEEPSTGRAMGELYSEILYYKDVADRASKRLDVYRKRLRINM